MGYKSCFVRDTYSKPQLFKTKIKLASLTIASLRRKYYNIHNISARSCVISDNCILLEQDQTLVWTCVTGAHRQCENNHYANFEYKGMKSV